MNIPSAPARPRAAAKSDAEAATLDPSVATKRSHLKFWVVCLFGMVSLAATIALLVPIPPGGRAQPAIGDMVHCPLFAGLTLFTFGCWRFLRPLTSLRQSLLRALACTIGFFVVGIIIEWVQSFLGRSATLHDIFSNGLGALVGWILILGWAMRRWRKLPHWAYASVGVSAMLPIGLAWHPSIATLVDIRAMSSEFPLLGSFERPAELDRWHFAKCVGRRELSDASDGSYSLGVRYPSSLLGLWPVATMHQMKHDWTGMESLSLDATLDPQYPGQSIEIAIQVIDQKHDKKFRNRFRRKFTLLPGAKETIEIPCDQMISRRGLPLDLDKILYLDLQLVRAESAATVRFDAIRLNPKPKEILNPERSEHL